MDLTSVGKIANLFKLTVGGRKNWKDFITTNSNFTTRKITANPVQTSPLLSRSFRAVGESCVINLIPDQLQQAIPSDLLGAGINSVMVT